MKNKLRTGLAALCLGARLLSPVKAPANELFVQAGIMPDAAWITPKSQEINKNVLFQTIGAEIDFLHLPQLGFIPPIDFFVGGDMTIFEVPQTNTLAPWVFYSSFAFNTGIKLGENFKILYEHRSNHPVDPYSVPMIAIDQFYDRVLFEYRKKF